MDDDDSIDEKQQIRKKARITVNDESVVSIDSEFADDSP